MGASRYKIIGYGKHQKANELKNYVFNQMQRALSSFFVILCAIP